MAVVYEKASEIIKEMQRILSKDNEEENLRINRLWHTISYIRASRLATMLRTTIGDTVQGGPFKGMRLTPDVMTGAYAPALLGMYEHELHSVFEGVIKQPFKKIVNIGCAYGYYSVGLAMRMPQVTVDSFDINEGCQKRCRDMATLNGVQDRIHVAGEFRGEDFAKYIPGETLVLMDIEGGEKDLLDPVKYPALKKLHVILEMHDVFDKEISQLMTERFSASHDIQIVGHTNIMYDLTQITGPVRYIDPIDNMLVTWENRGGPTPWAIMKPKSA
ncbi:MAG TPA: hypothetical protein VFR09_00515 [Alphaproteobacteria bacterium]|nr:hypothetical protein [Alphaproteobacteria bacterium]